MIDLNDLRKRIVEGGECTTQELRDAIEQMRTVRVEASIKTAKKREEKIGASDAELDSAFAHIKTL